MTGNRQKLPREKERNLKKRSAELLHELEKLEEKASALEHDMSLPENYSDGVKIKKNERKVR